MRIEFVDLGRQYKKHKTEIDSAIKNVLNKHEFILGEEVEKFEREFADFCEAKYCIGVASGTDALFLSLKALGVGAGDEVITTPHSFVSTALSISNLGAKPVFVDIDLETYNIDPKKIEEKITEKTKVILPVHIYGQPANMDAIKGLAKKNHLKILEDACQAHGAVYKGKRVGVLGDIAAFSFHPSKNLGAYGDGGAVVTDNKELAEKVLKYRTYGGIKRDHYEDFGINSRLDNLQAAILRVKLRHLEEWNSKRRSNAALYEKFLKNSGAGFPKIKEDAESVFHLYVVRTHERDGLRDWLGKNGVKTLVHYPTPIHLQKIYKDLGYKKGDFPEAELAAGEILSLPVFPELDPSEIKYISESIMEFYKK